MFRCVTYSFFLLKQCLFWLQTDAVLHISDQRLTAQRAEMSKASSGSHATPSHGCRSGQVLPTCPALIRASRTISQSIISWV